MSSRSATWKEESKRRKREPVQLSLFDALTGLDQNMDTLKKSVGRVEFEIKRAFGKSGPFTTLFDSIVVKVLLPVFTSILGYIFGSRTDKKNES